MMRKSLFVVACGSAALAGCNTEPAVTAPGARASGRYSGVGVFDAGRLWAQISGSPGTTDKRAAILADDEHIIVVLDSHTGEVRQCGDHSGYCVAMKPWGAAGLAPVNLALHASDLDAEREQAENAASAEPIQDR